MTETAWLMNYPLFCADNLPDNKCDYEKGAVFLVDKPKEWSSFDVVKYLRKCLQCKKVGHAGTLDPMATGLLIVCSGKATKIISHFQDMKKRYRAIICFGASTPSHDAETEIEEKKDFKHVTRDMVIETIDQQFTGDIEQVPPMYSALKHKGTPLYKLARKGKQVERQPRKITIYNLEMIDFNLPEVTLLINCSKGTYIRMIAHDLGRSLNTGAYLKKLRREAIGQYEVSNALTIGDLKEISFK